MAAHSIRAWCRPSSDAVERERRRPGGVLHRDGRAVASSQEFQDRGGRVVHVASAGRRRDHQPRALERAGPLELAHRQVDPFLLGRCALDADVRTDRCGNGRLAHHFGDLVGRGHHPHVPAARARQRVEGHVALDAPAEERVGRRDVERGLGRLLHVLDAMQRLDSKDASARAEPRECGGVRDRTPYRGVARERPRQGSRQHICELALPGPEYRHPCGHPEPERERLDRRGVHLLSRKVGVERGAPVDPPGAYCRERAAGGTDHCQGPAAAHAAPFERLLERADERPRRSAHREPEPSGARSCPKQRLTVFRARTRAALRYRRRSPSHQRRWSRDSTVARRPPARRPARRAPTPRIGSSPGSG